MATIWPARGIRRTKRRRHLKGRPAADRHEMPIMLAPSRSDQTFANTYDCQSRANVLKVGQRNPGRHNVVKFSHAIAVLVVGIAPFSPVLAQSEYEALLCEAAESGRVIEIVYDQDEAKGCLPRLLDVHQVAVGNNGQLYLHGWQTRGCTKGRDYESERIFRFDKIRSVETTEGAFSERSQSVKDAGWDGCIGSNCFIDKNICE